MARMVYVAMDVSFPDINGGAKRAYETTKIFRDNGHDVSMLVVKRPGEKTYEKIDGIHVYRASIIEIGLFVRKFFTNSSIFRKLFNRERSIKLVGTKEFPDRSGIKSTYDVYINPKPLRGVKNKLTDFYRHKFPLHKYIRNIFATKLLWRIIRERKIDFIVERGPSYGVSALVSRLVSRIYAIDFIDIMYSNYALRKADVILSYFSTIQIPQFIPRDKIKIVFHAADEKKFKPAQKDPNFLKKLGISEKDFVLIYSGAMYPWHGIDAMILAVKILRDEGISNVKLILLGDGHIRPIMESLVEKHNLEKWVIFTGKVPFDDVPKYLANSDVALSLNTADSIGFKLIEYMAAGKAILTTNLDLVHKLADNGKDMFFVPPDDSKAVARCVKTLMEKPELKKQFEVNVRKRFLRDLTWTTHYRNILDGIITSIKKKRK